MFPGQFSGICCKSKLLASGVFDTEFGVLQHVDGVHLFLRSDQFCLAWFDSMANGFRKTLVDADVHGWNSSGSREGKR